MADWFGDRIIDAVRLPLFCFFAGIVVGDSFRPFVAAVRIRSETASGTVAR
jgi:hypothetical protein